MDRLSRIEGKLDAILKHSGVSFDAFEGLPAEVLEAVRQGQKIEAIKRYRHATGVGLQEAKDVIEEALRRNV
jgi:ribosomal protein L7/L12